MPGCLPFIAPKPLAAPGFVADLPDVLPLPRPLAGEFGLMLGPFETPERRTGFSFPGLPPTALPLTVAGPVDGPRARAGVAAAPDLPAGLVPLFVAAGSAGALLSLPALVLFAGDFVPAAGELVPGVAPRFPGELFGVILFEFAPLVVVVLGD